MFNMKGIPRLKIYVSYQENYDYINQWKKGNSAKFKKSYSGNIILKDQITKFWLMTKKMFSTIRENATFFCHLLPPLWTNSFMNGDLPESETMFIKESLSETECSHFMPRDLTQKCMVHRTCSNFPLQIWKTLYWIF